MGKKPAAQRYERNIRTHSDKKSLRSPAAFLSWGQDDDAASEKGRRKRCREHRLWNAYQFGKLSARVDTLETAHNAHVNAPALHR